MLKGVGASPTPFAFLFDTFDAFWRPGGPELTYLRRSAARFGPMPAVDFAAMSYTETKGLLFRQLPISAMTSAKCDIAEACIDMLQVTRPSESEHAGTRLATRDLDTMREQIQKRRAVNNWNARSFETVIPTDDLQ